MPQVARAGARGTPRGAFRGGENGGSVAFVVVGVIGLALLVLALLLDTVFDAAFEALDVFDTGWLSAASIGGFLAALGLVGWVLQGSFGTTLATGAGVGAGVLVGGVAGWAARALATGATDSGRHSDDLVGLDGVVLTPVTGSESYGEVSLTIHGHKIKLAARAAEPLPVGARVWVVEVLSPTSVLVQPVDELDGSAGASPAIPQ